MSNAENRASSQKGFFGMKQRSDLMFEQEWHRVSWPVEKPWEQHISEQRRMNGGKISKSPRNMSRFIDKNR